MIKRLLTLSACCFVLSSLGLAQTSQQTVERWDTLELTFKSTLPYQNPFQDAWLRASFRHATEATITVDGFYDGEGTWKVRFMPTQQGRWHFSTQSDDDALKGHSGSIECVPPEKPYLRGPLVPDGFHFRHPDGEWRFLVSTRLSCHFASPAVWKEVIAFLKEHGINRVLFMLPGVRGTSGMLYGSNGDLDSYNVPNFQKIDSFVDALRKADIIASPYFYYFDDKFQRQLTADQDESFLRYCMARFGAYANVMPVLANEVELKYSERRKPHYDLRSHEWANRLGILLKELAVFGVPVSVHNPMETYEASSPGFFALLKDWPFAWTDFMLRQVQVGALGAVDAVADDVPEPEYGEWNARGYARHNQLLIDLRRYAIPVINEEPGYELGGKKSWDGLASEAFLATAWTATVAGAYVMWGSPATYELENPFPELEQTVTPSNLRILSLVMSGLPFWEMEPRNDVVNGNPVVIDDQEYRSNFALAQPGRYYLIYSLDGGRVEVEVEPGVYQAKVVDLMSSEDYVDDPGVEQMTEDGMLTYSLARGRQWVVVIRRVDSAQ